MVGLSKSTLSHSFLDLGLVGGGLTVGTRWGFGATVGKKSVTVVRGGVFTAIPFSVFDTRTVGLIHRSRLQGFRCRRG